MKNEFKLFLKKNGFLPIETWSNFEIIHGKANEDFVKIIKNNVSDKDGVYIYIKERNILYVGKAKPLWGRIKSHFRESYEEVSGDTKLKTWHKFFSNKNNIGLVKILYKEVPEELERQIIEKMLDYVLCPTFNDFRRKLEKKCKKLQ